MRAFTRGNATDRVGRGGHASPVPMTSRGFRGRQRQKTDGDTRNIRWSSDSEAISQLTIADVVREPELALEDIKLAREVIHPLFHTRSERSRQYRSQASRSSRGGGDAIPHVAQTRHPRLSVSPRHFLITFPIVRQSSPREFLTESRKLSSKSALSPSFLRNSGSCLVDITAGAGPRCRASTASRYCGSGVAVNLTSASLRLFKRVCVGFRNFLLIFVFGKFDSRDKGSKHFAMTWRTISATINNARTGSGLPLASLPCDWSKTD